MGDQNIVDAAYGTTKAILESKPVENLTDPPTKVAGNLLADFLNWTAGGIHYASMKAELKRQKKFEKFKANIAEGVNNIPKEDLIEPRDSIIGAAAEKAKYSMNEDEIREMFENLIISSFDSRKVSNIHPSFSDIIQQMSPLDAQNLKLFDTKERLPVCELRLDQGPDGYKVIYSDVFYSNPNCQSIQQQAISISSLKRIGLISISYDIHFIDKKIYEPFKELPEYKVQQNNLESLNQLKKTNHKLDIQQGVASITSLGKAFIDVCLSPLPKKSNP